jgi:hypothetical protein
MNALSVLEAGGGMFECKTCVQFVNIAFIQRSSLITDCLILLTPLKCPKESCPI